MKHHAYRDCSRPTRWRPSWEPGRTPPVCAGRGDESTATATSTTLGRLAVFAACCYGMMTVSFVNAGDRFPQAGASLYTLLHAMGNAGAALGVLLIGLLAELWNLPAAMAILMLGPALSLALLLAALARPQGLARVAVRRRADPRFGQSCSLGSVLNAGSVEYGRG